MIKQIAKRTSVYALSEGISKGGMVLLLPFITSYVTAEEYGQIGNMLMVVSVSSIIFSLSLSGALNRYYHEYEVVGKDREFVSNVLIFQSIFIFSGAILLSLGKVFVDDKIELVNHVHTGGLFIILATQPFVTSNFSLYKTQKLSRKFATKYFLYFFLQIFLILYLFEFERMGVNSYVFALAASNLMFYSHFLFEGEHRRNFTFDSNQIKLALRYALPHLPVDVIGLLNTMISRGYIVFILGLAMAGKFFAIYQVSMLINMVAVSINSAISPDFFRSLDDQQSMRKLNHLQLNIIVLIFSLVSLFGQLIGALYASVMSTEYGELSYLIQYMLFFASFITFYLMLTNHLSVNPYLIRLKSKVIITVTVINYLVSYYAINVYGVDGALLTLFFLYAVPAAIFFLIIKRQGVTFIELNNVVPYVMGLSLPSLIFSFDSLVEYLMNTFYVGVFLILWMVRKNVVTHIR